MIKTISIIITFVFLNFFGYRATSSAETLQVKSIDTMKYSRDLARSVLKDPEFDATIDKQVKLISELGATHVAIGTPYDNEFLPVLERWVKAARKYNLKVWFRGNFSGWENWFDYPDISRNAHTSKTQTFILNNEELFEDGDIFTSCPECENGGPVSSVYDDIEGHKKFLAKEYAVVKEAFKDIDKDVSANFYSMNGDVAKLVMDKETTKALDGVVTIDHYVESVDQLEKDIQAYAENSGGKVVLGEIGAPIPDIHGDMTEREQSEWLSSLFAKLQKNPEVIGINYWVGVGGSTAIWSSDGKARESHQVLKNYYQGIKVNGKVTDTAGNPISNALVKTVNEEYRTNSEGVFSIPFFYKGQKLEVEATGLKIKTVANIQTVKDGVIVLNYTDKSHRPKTAWLERFIKLIFAPFISTYQLLTNS